MLLTDGDALVIGAVLAKAAMDHEKLARVFEGAGNRAEAQKNAAFAGECCRLAEMFNPALKNRLAR
jgi:hypothetical protein